MAAAAIPNTDKDFSVLLDCVESVDVVLRFLLPWLLLLLLLVLLLLFLLFLPGR